MLDCSVKRLQTLRQSRQLILLLALFGATISPAATSQVSAGPIAPDQYEGCFGYSDMNPVSTKTYNVRFQKQVAGYWIEIENPPPRYYNLTFHSSEPQSGGFYCHTYKKTYGPDAPTDFPGFITGGQYKIIYYEVITGVPYYKAEVTWTQP